MGLPIIRKKLSLLLLLVCVWVVGSLSAAPVGSIKGYVRDASSAVLPSASLELKNEQTNLVQNTTSDATGFYQFLDLPPGMYSITAEVPGFRKELVKSVSVLVDQIVSVDVKLVLGQVTEVVEVNGGVYGSDRTREILDRYELRSQADREPAAH